MTDRPNIIWITTDQQRIDNIRCTGSDFMNTPNMDRIARVGVTFQKANCPNTVCTSSRNSMMTGLPLSKHGACNIGTQAIHQQWFISQILRNHGYETHHVGNAHWFPWGAGSPETAPVDEEGAPLVHLWQERACAWSIKRKRIA
ncbi:MAG TPA: sulfatase-like hydrolase/transferase [Bacillales bacterium]|nr:sulfatase-like hydrolase/transferase [Bacillales bacterium]